MVNQNSIPQVNWTQGSSLVSNEMSFEEKLKVVIRKAYRISREEELVDGDILLIGALSDWTNQTFHQAIEDIDGLYITKDIKRISRLAVCQNFKSNHAKFKRPIRLVNAQTVIFRDNTFIPLYKGNQDWLTAENAYCAMMKINFRSFGTYKGATLVKIILNSGMHPIEHLAYVYEGYKDTNLYCLLDSGFIFESKPEDVSEAPMEIGYVFPNTKLCSGDFVQYKNIGQNQKTQKFIEK